MTGREFLVPDLGEGLADVTITSWNVAVGDDVALNQPLCTVETAKAEVEIPSPYTGRITELRGAPGEVLEVGTLLARIEVPDDPDTTGGAGAGTAEAAPRRPVLVGYGTDDSFDTSRRTVATGDHRAKAKPAVRKLAADLGVDLAAVPPGPAGVVTWEAVLAAADRQPGDDREGLPVRGVHAVMAERMARAHREIPDAAASLQVDGTRLLAVCRELNDDGMTITPFTLTLRLTVLALGRHPAVNATWVESAGGAQVRRHRAVHLGIAVAAPRGLLVPVLTDAQDKSTRELADALDRLVGDARAGALAPAQLSGSTFTVSNFGALGVDSGIPVINPPEAAILGVGSLKPRPAVVDGAVVARPQMTVTCVFDHRVLDGAQAAGFLTELAGLIETADTALDDLRG
ncbi:dihydrolipoamide acetyltransferase family protein [Mycolicibacillus trivialis]